jgi:large subunit ribosomal protein L3
MKGLLGRKIGMTQIFDEKGRVTPVTVIQAGPCYVTQVKTEAHDGYDAVQLGFEQVKPGRVTRGLRGHLGLLKTDDQHPRRKSLAQAVPAVRVMHEVRTSSDETYTEGQELTVTIFEVGERVDVIGTSKGRGFQGGVKRHGFSGGPKTHGQSDRQRAPGSIGATTTPGRIFKGKHMAGHMGSVRKTIQNLQVMSVDAERHIITVRGAIPGPKNGLVFVRQARKA